MEEIKDAKDLKVVHTPGVKLDAMGLACGNPAYAGDVDFPNMLYAKMLWSPHAYAKIKNIDTSEAWKVPGVKAILTYKDVPRVPHTTAGQGYPEPSPYDTYTLDDTVRYVGDRVAAVAAETLEAAMEAGADDLVTEEEIFTIYTAPDAVAEVAEYLTGKGYELLSAQAEMVPQNTVSVTGEDDVKNLRKMLDMFEDNDDVQNVWHNWEEDE